MAYSMLISAPAERQFEQAVAYIAVILASPNAAGVLADAYEGALLSMTDNPHAYPVDFEQSSIAGGEIRRCLVRGYAAYFRIDESVREVHVLAFLHQSQDASFALSRWSF